MHTGQFDLALIALDCCGDRPFAGVLCLNDLSFPSLVTHMSILKKYICSHILIP